MYIEYKSEATINAHAYNTVSLYILCLDVKHTIQRAYTCIEYITIMSYGKKRTHMNGHNKATDECLPTICQRKSTSNSKVNV